MFLPRRLIIHILFNPKRTLYVIRYRRRSNWRILELYKIDYLTLHVSLFQEESRGIDARKRVGLGHFSPLFWIVDRGIIIGEISAGSDSQEVTSGAASKRQLDGFTCAPRESSRCPFLPRCEKFLDPAWGGPYFISGTRQSLSSWIFFFFLYRHNELLQLSEG